MSLRRGPDIRRYIQMVDRFRHNNGALSRRLWYPGMACSICGEPIRPWQLFNRDHVIPMSAGGRKGRENKAYAHVLCNSVKGDRHPFSLRTPAEREAVRALVKPATYERLLRTWAGEAA